MVSRVSYYQGKRKAQRLLRRVEARCVAYQRFLRQHQIGKKRRIFTELPLTDKTNYITKFPLEERLYQGKKLSDYYMVCTSTGSTGEPTIWPRDMSFDESLIKPHTKFLDHHFGISKKKSLILIALGLGSSQAGIMHLKASWGACRDAKVTVISPNGDAEITVFLLEKLHSQFDQIICLGYPPIINDFIDLAIKKHIDIKKWRMKIGVTSESVSPSWRLNAIKAIGGKGKDFVAWYGSTEAGMIGFETRELNEVIQHALDNDDFRKTLFGTYTLPTFVEVDYGKRFIEIVNNEIVITADQTVPLIRYNTHDRGRLISGNDIYRALKDHNLHISSIIPKSKIYLAAYGRNVTKQLFSTEDIRYVLDKTNIYASFLNEFQYNEKDSGGVSTIMIVLYKKVQTISPSIKRLLSRQITEELQKILPIKRDIVLRLFVKDKKEAKGYKYGKLRYSVTV